ncbi:MAG: ATP-binding cassette domain-containing protein [Candidatus Fermentibacter sp.]|nr:ATP-binding cassette domain-containing protein [Candidatus Fermentibacter sp.]
MSGAILKAEGVGRSFGSLRVLDGLDLEASPGEFLGIIGRSGTGKSTLLGILGTHDLEFEGRLELDGREVKSATPAGLASMRRDVLGYVFQDFHLLPELTALENAILPAVFSGRDAESARNSAIDVMDQLGVRIDSTPTAMLSRGERQRVAVARGLVNRPGVLLADEPSASLDDDNENILFDMLDGLRRKQGFTLIAVVHSHAVLSRADRVLELREGRLRPAERNVPPEGGSAP